MRPVTMPKHTVVVDTNNIFHAAFHSPKLTDDNGNQTQAVFYSIRSLIGIYQTYKDAEIVLAWDDSSARRRELYSEYKANRAPMTDAERLVAEQFRFQMDAMRRICLNLGVKQVLPIAAEADDYAAWTVRYYADEPEHQITLISGDKDWLQLIQRPNIKWFDPIRSRECTTETFAAFTGYKTPLAYLEGKALQGDKSDNISGVGSIGEKGAADLLSEFGSVANFVKRYRSGELGKVKKAWSDFATSEEKINIFKRNMRLMNLLMPEHEIAFKTIMADELEEEELLGEFERLNFISMIENFDEVVRPFRLNYLRGK